MKASDKSMLLDEFRAFFLETFEKFVALKTAAPTGRKTADVVAELLEAKQRANRRSAYVTSLRQFVTRFAREFPDLGAVSADDIEKFLRRFDCPSSRQTWLNRVSTLFSFAVRRGYLKENPCDRVERVMVDRKTPAILTPEQANTLLASCRADCRAYLVLALYAGIRPAEIQRLDWADVSFETKTVRVDGKTRRRRVVPLEPIAARLLAQCPKKQGRVAPSLSTLKRWKREARKCLGGKWPADILRHTAATYLLALYEDAGRVSYWLGNSPKILLAHYDAATTKAEATKFWGN